MEYVQLSLFLDVEIGTEKFQMYISSGTGPLLAQFVEAGCRTLYFRPTCLVSLFGIRKNSDSSGCTLLLFLFIKGYLSKNITC
jgi:hypothetical protein